MSRSSSRARSRLAAIAATTLAAMALSAQAASAGPGYQRASGQPSIALNAEVPIGVAVDQVSQRVYVAELSEAILNVAPGQVEQLSATGVPTASSPFSTGGQDLFTAVAVNPATQGVYAYQAEGQTPFGLKGTSKMSAFSSTGVLGTSFTPTNSATGGLAADAAGRVFFPSSNGGAVQIFSSAGGLEGTLSCGGCPGGSFGEPSSVAFDSAGNLYVVDRSGAGRVVKLAPNAGTYVYASTVQSGGGPAAVAVDTSNDDVFVGSLVGNEYHVIAYDAAGTEFDDFGAELVSKSLVQLATGQLAANATTHRLYLSDPGGNRLLVFERVASIPAPTAAAAAPSPLGQLEATLRATVNPKGHVLTECEFEYTDHADFLANGYANAETAACPAIIGDPEGTSVTAAVNGLTPGTSYDYRIQIASHGGSAESGNQSFQTLPPLPPEATAGSASSVTKTSATLAGSVNPKGGPISSCRFEYVDEAKFQVDGFTAAILKACSPLPSGNFSNAVTAKISGLSAGTAYRFRVGATNNVGTTEALDSSFTTAAETCSENPALCPPPAEETTPPPPTPPAPLTAPPATPPAAKPLKCRKGFKKKRVRGKLKCVKVKKARR